MVDRTPFQDMIGNLEKTVAELQPIVARAEAELKFHQENLRRAERALTVLRGEPLRKDREGPVVKKPATREFPVGIAEDRMALVKELILEFAEEHEEFRQVDIRSMPGAVRGTDRSSLMATAFERLRQENFIRLARKSGNNKYYRLTQQTLAGRNGNDDAAA